MTFAQAHWRAAFASCLLASLAVVACSVNPATGQRQVSLIGEQQEIEMGRQADKEIVASMGLYQDQDVQAYVQQLGRKLSADSERPNLPWTFRVVDDPVVNAFALPGGFIYVTRGLMSHLTSEAELASVIGHEIGHVTGRHSVERLSKAQLAQIGLIAGMILEPRIQNYADLANTGLGLLFLKYSRDDEREADDLGLRYVYRENYDPREMAEVFRVLRAASQLEGQQGGRIPGWLQTHPTPDERIARVTERVKEVEGGLNNAVVARERYMNQIDNLVFGENPREGYFRGNTFVHPELGFQLSFPQGWKTNNQKQAVAAISPREDAIVVLTLAQRDSPQAAAREFFGQQGIQQGQALRADLGGLPAVAHVFGVQTQQGQLQGIAAFVEHGDRVFQILGYTGAGNFRRYDDQLSGALASFSRVTDRRALDVQPKRVDVVTLPSAMTLSEFARRYPSTVDLETLAVINHVGGNTQLAAGTEVKRVVGGVPGESRAGR